MKIYESNPSSMLISEINYYINLLRIKKAETGSNTELDYQLKVQRHKLIEFGVDTTNFEIDQT